MSGVGAGSALAGLDPVLNAPKRLAIMAVLAGSAFVEFAFLRDYLDVSDSDLSKQASTLEAAGYIDIRKSGHGRGGRTTYVSTTTGRRAYERHRAALRSLLEE